MNVAEVGIGAIVVVGKSRVLLLQSWAGTWHCIATVQHHLHRLSLKPLRHLFLLHSCKNRTTAGIFSKEA